MNYVEAFTDGACKGNPGPGGWGVLLRYGQYEKQLFGGEIDTTNNRMELFAAIVALESLNRPCSIKVTTDSQYVQRGITEWIFRWVACGWRKMDKQPVKNSDLWQRLYKMAQFHDIEWYWIKGHDGHRENEIADKLANQGIEWVLTNSSNRDIDSQILIQECDFSTQKQTQQKMF